MADVTGEENISCQSQVLTAGIRYRTSIIPASLHSLCLSVNVPSSRFVIAPFIQQLVPLPMLLVLHFCLFIISYKEF